MIIFLIPYAIVFGGLFLVGELMQDDTLWWISRQDPLFHGAVLFALPMLTAFGSVELVSLLSPRRVLDPRVRRPIALLVAGTIGACAAACLSPLFFVLVDSVTGEAAILVACTALSTIGVLLPFRRRRAGHCLCCGYDLRSRGQSTAGAAPLSRCPECGSVATAA